MQDTPRIPKEWQTDLARQIARLSIDQWGERRATMLIGTDERFVDAQDALLRFGGADAPVLVSGATGTGKELFARALHLLSARRRQPFVCVNCAQYHDTQLLASELFGHKKGSFTGAIADHLGVFEEADHGTVLLDEIAELSPAAQGMLLRTLSEGEVIRVGESKPRRVDVRTIAASARDLQTMVAAGLFREDLFYRLRFLRVRVPSLAERGNDWRLVAAYYLAELNRRGSTAKSFSPRAFDLLSSYAWPGNIRELRGIVEMAYCSAPGDAIESCHFEGELAPAAEPATPASAALVTLTPVASTPASGRHDDLFLRLTAGRENFWDVVYRPFMGRELNRAEVKTLVGRALRQTQGSYKDATALLGLAERDYLKFMDFLRHHDLKPTDRRRRRNTSGDAVASA